MPKPARGTTFICSPASPLRSARISCQDRQPWIGSGVSLGASAAWNRARWRATRGLSGSSGSCAVIMWRPGGQTPGLRMAVAEPTDENRACSIGQHQVEAAPGAGIEGGEAPRRPCRRIGAPAPEAAVRRGFACLRPARGCRAGSAPRRPRRRGSRPSTCRPRTVATRDDARPIGPVSGWRVPCAVQHLIAIGGKHQRPGMGGADQDDDGAHYCR